MDDSSIDPLPSNFWTEMQLRSLHIKAQRGYGSYPSKVTSTARKFLGWDLNSSFHLIPKPMLFTNILSWPSGPDSPKCQVEIVWNHQQGQWQTCLLSGKRRY